MNKKQFAPVCKSCGCLFVNDNIDTGDLCINCLIKEHEQRSSLYETEKIKIDQI